MHVNPSVLGPPGVKQVSRAVFARAAATSARLGYDAVTVTLYGDMRVTTRRAIAYAANAFNQPVPVALCWTV